MSIETLGVVYSGANESGSSMLIGIGQGNRYSHLNGSTLDAFGLHDNLQSGFLFESQHEDVSVIIFGGDQFTGPFVQMTAPKGNGRMDFWSTSVSSLMLIATPTGGSGLTMLSYQNLFRSDWDTVIDDQIGSDGWRNGEPVLSWEMFPDNPAYQWLDPNLGYLKVHQDLVAKTPWWWPSNYNVWLEYWIYLYPSDGNVRCVVPQYWWWIEGGALQGDVHDKFVPKVQAGASVLQDHLNQKFATFDGLTNGKVKDIFYLPGAQSSTPGSDVHGNTGDDITIVIAT